MATDNKHTIWLLFFTIVYLIYVCNNMHIIEELQSLKE